MEVLPLTKLGNPDRDRKRIISRHSNENVKWSIRYISLESKFKFELLVYRYLKP